MVFATLAAKVSSGLYCITSQISSSTVWAIVQSVVKKERSWAHGLYTLSRAGIP